jgi:hypothetical protein
VSTIMGTLQQFGVVAGSVPSWVWWGIAIALLFVTAIRIDMKLLDAQRRKSPESNMPLQEVVHRITGYSSPSEDGGNAGQIISNAFCTIREFALQGHLAVFARRDVNMSDLNLYPRELIPSDFWDTHHIGYIEYMQDRRGAMTRVRVGGEDRRYKDLYFDRAQIDARWSAPRLVIDWRSPIRRKEKAVART